MHMENFGCQQQSNFPHMNFQHLRLIILYNCASSLLYRSCVSALDLKCTGCLHVPTVSPFKFNLVYSRSLCSGWCGEVRDVIYTDKGKVTVVYRVTVRGTDGEVPHYYLICDSSLVLLSTTLSTRAVFS